MSYSGVSSMASTGQASSHMPQKMQRSSSISNFGGVLLAVVPGGFGGGDVDAVGGADGRAHHAGDALDAAGLVAVEAVDAAEVGGFHAAVFDGDVLAALFGVLDGAGGGALVPAGEEVADGGGEPSDDFREVEALGGGHLWDVAEEDVFVADGHGVIVAWWAGVLGSADGGVFGVLWYSRMVGRKGDFTMAGKFDLKQAKDGQYMFNLKAGNGEIILTSELYKAKASAENGIRSVQENSQKDERFDRLMSKSDQPYFTLKAGNGEVIGRSEMYSSEAARDNGIASVKTNGSTTKIDDQC